MEAKGIVPKSIKVYLSLNIDSDSIGGIGNRPIGRS